MAHGEPCSHRFHTEIAFRETPKTSGASDAVGHQTARHAGDVMQYQESFTARLQALSYSHDLLVRDTWPGASFNDVIAAQVRPFLEDREERIRTASER